MVQQTTTPPWEDQRNAGSAEEMLPKKTGTTQHDLFIVSKARNEP
jgi:hypothetical protein